MNQLTVNEKHHFTIEEKEGRVFIDATEFKFDLKKIKDNTFHILHENRSYTAELVSIDRKEKHAKVKINGNEYDVSLYDQYSKLLDEMGMDFSTKNTEVTLKASMPGLVLEIMVKEGDQVNKGDNLLVLEAMKMENMIKSSADVTIKSIEVEKGSKVEKNQILLTFE
jgi:biotin carboxyl carrier protein